MSGNGKSAKVVPLTKRKCPICGKPADATFKPFCCKRCADIDLGRWLGDGYRIETDEAPEPGGPMPEDEAE